MSCIICNQNMEYYFSKEYTEEPYSEFMKNIGKVNYHKCTNCGFVLSKTHCDLKDSEWESLNDKFHNHLESNDLESEINQPPYLDQALMISVLEKNGILNTKSMIDYAAGYGSLSKILKKYFGIDMNITDPYIKESDACNYIDEKSLGKYSTVINAAMFEHVLDRKSLDKVNDLVDENGSLIVHTRISGYIPDDPNWFYLRPPVHTAFHTNKSMDILMDQWGYSASIYCLPARCWILLKKFDDGVEEKIDSINRELQRQVFFFKRGFLDYWKDY